MKKIFANLSVGALLAASALPGFAADPIFSFDFQDETTFPEDFTVQDLNNDGTTWKWNKYTTGSKPYYYAVCYNWNASSYMDAMSTKKTFALQAGHAYILTFEGWCDSTPAGSPLAVGIFPASDASQMKPIFNTTLTNINKYNSEQPPVYEAIFEVEEDGEYGFTFMVTGSYAGGAALDNIVLVDGGSPLTPAVATSVEAEAAADFSLKATLNIQLPAKTVTNSELPSISKVEILKGGTVVDRLTSGLTPGATVSWTDNNAAEGINTYSVVVYNGELASDPVEASVYVGPLTPNVPTSVKAAKAEGGKIQITWSAPTGSAEGETLNASLVKFNVKRSINGAAATTVASAITETEYLDTPPASDEFQTIVYSVETVYGPKTSEGVEANAVKVGSYVLPFDESFANGILPEDWEITTKSTGYSAYPWTAASKMSQNPYANPYDQDGGLLNYNSCNAYSSEWSRAITPEINLSGSVAPVLEFWFYHSTIGSSYADRIEIEISDNGGEFVTLENSEIKRYGTTQEWTLYQFPLAAYKNSKVRISFKATSGHGYDMAIDAIRIYNGKSNDLEAGAIAAKANSVNSGDDAEFTFTVKNAAFGDVAADAYSVKVYANGELAATLDGKDIAAGQGVDFDFTIPTHAGHTSAGLSVCAEVVFADDEDDSNNESDIATVEVNAYGGDGVTGLKGAVENGTLRLTWDDIEVEDFEKLESVLNLDDEDNIITKDEYDADPSVAAPSQFTGSNGQVWLNIDADGKTIPSQYSMKAGARGFMFSSWDMTVNSSHKDFSGVREHGMLVAMSPAKADGAASDYIVAPVLPGKGKHVLEFQGKTYSTEGASDFYVEYTTESDFTASDIAQKFQPLGEKVHINANYQEGNKWNKYSYIIPSNAKYVAIHFVGETTITYEYDSWSYETTEVPKYSTLCLDDIKIVSEPMTKPTYNVYYSENAGNEETYALRAVEVASAAKKHNSAPVTTNSYVIASPAVSTNYHVTAVYPEGETALSAPYYYDVQSGVELVEAAASAQVVKVEGRTISVIANGENAQFDLYAINGATVALGVESYSVAAPGVYVVKVGSKAVTVLVK